MEIRPYKVFIFFFFFEMPFAKSQVWQKYPILAFWGDGLWELTCGVLPAMDEIWDGLDKSH